MANAMLGLRNFLQCWKDPGFRFVPFIFVGDKKSRRLDCNYSNIYSLYVFIGDGSRLFLLRAPHIFKFLIFRRVNFGKDGAAEVYRTEDAKSFVGTIHG